MHNFIPNTPADNAVKEMADVMTKHCKTNLRMGCCKDKEECLSKALVDAGFGNIAQFAKEAAERILAHKHKFIDPDEECPFGDTEEVDVYWVQRELEKLVEEYTKRNFK